MFRARSLPWIALTGLLATLPSCGGSTGTPSRARGSADADPSGVPGVVVLVLDTLRADGLTACGGRGLMPALDAFAAESTVFADASANATWTAPSVASILTGLEPAHHGVLGAFRTPPLAPSFLTLAEKFAGAGWFTAAFVSGGWVAPEHGVAQGFDAFGTSFDSQGPEALLSTWERRRPKDCPFFLFLHTYAPHDPYGEKVRRRPGDGAAIAAVVERAERIVFETERAGGRLSSADARFLCDAYLTDAPARYALIDAIPRARWEPVWDQFKHWMSGPWASEPGSADLAASLRAAYDEGLRVADRVVDRTLQVLDGLRLPAGTVTVVCSDHGEGFGEHRALSHGGHLFDEVLRVPLVVRAPGRMKPGLVRGSCALVDVFPTALELAGLRVPSGIDGRSLLPLAAGETHGRPVLAEDVRPKPDRSDEAPYELISVRTERAKFVRVLDPVSHDSTDEVYDLVDDPAERRALPLDAAKRLGDDFVRRVRAVRETPRRDGPAGLVPAALVDVTFR